MRLSRMPLAFGIPALLFACARIADLESVTGSATADGGRSDEATSSLVVTPEELTFAPVVCGTQAGTSASFVVHNPTRFAIPYTVEIPGSSSFVLLGADRTPTAMLRGQAGPGADATIEVSLVATRDAAELGTDVLISANEVVQKIRVSAKVTGAALAFTPSLVDFGDVRRDTTIPDETVEVENVGNDPVLIQSFTRTGSTELGLEGGNLTILPGEKRALPAKFASGPEGSEQIADLVPTTDRPLCGVVPRLTLKGTRVNQDVLVNPATLDFGDVSCISDPAREAKVLTISNYGALSRSFTVTLPKGAESVYTAEPMSGFVPAGNPSKTPITVRRKPGLALRAYPESVIIDVTGAPAAKTASLDVNVVGALLEISPSSLTGVGGNGKTFSVKNIGNRYIALRHASSANAFGVTGTSTLNPNETERPLVKLLATSKGRYEANITTTRDKGADLCAAPIRVAVSGTK